MRDETVLSISQELFVDEFGIAVLDQPISNRAQATSGRTMFELLVLGARDGSAGASHMGKSAKNRILLNLIAPPDWSPWRREATYTRSSVNLRSSYVVVMPSS
jgi:hypothetical protein